MCLLVELLRPKILVKTSLRLFSTTRVLNAEPPKKKRRLDPGVLKLRVERKIRKAEREINRIEKEPRQLIPILEYELTNSEIKDLKSRPTRNMQDCGVTESVFKGAGRLWSFHRKEQCKIQDRSLQRMQHAQEDALRVLKELDSNLYDRTVSVEDISLIPYSSSLIKKETAPKKLYKPPDGYIKNTTKEWVM